MNSRVAAACTTLTDGGGVPLISVGAITAQRSFTSSLLLYLFTNLYLSLTLLVSRSAISI